MGWDGIGWVKLKTIFEFDFNPLGIGLFLGITFFKYPLCYLSSENFDIRGCQRSVLLPDISTWISYKQKMIYTSSTEMNILFFSFGFDEVRPDCHNCMTINLDDNMSSFLFTCTLISIYNLFLLFRILCILNLLDKDINR